MKKWGCNMLAFCINVEPHLTSSILYRGAEAKRPGEMTSVNALWKLSYMDTKFLEAAIGMHSYHWDKLAWIYLSLTQDILSPNEAFLK